MTEAPFRKEAFPYVIKALVLLGLVIVVSSCAYRHYLGMHGPSVKKYPSIHATAVADDSCLECHVRDSSIDAPKTGHPSFKGCLKCHNDDLTSGSLDRRGTAIMGRASQYSPEASSVPR